ncbi:MAG: polysaccharide biosynthesis tyrosine autokinase [Prevotellaceae bacterium]|jgi:capsular exopolysaccharide synthesis family protein|nr:polysaccharide biosynthesis tyrosine autokinase [Prevotellaceae bacterium]
MEATYNNPTTDPFFDDENSSSFNIVEWAIKFFRYWYLFVICVAIALAAAYLKNRTWQPAYQTSAQVMIDEGRGNQYQGSMNMMKGFGVQAGLRNVNNQIVLFGSYDLVRKVIKELPFTVDCYSRGRFKTNNLYKINPIEIKPLFIHPAAYGKEYQITDKGENFHIEWKAGKKEHSLTGKYGEVLQNPLFAVLISKSVKALPEGFKFQFAFRSEDELVASYCSRLKFDFAMPGSSVVSASLTGSVAQRDIDFLNALCDAFVQENLNRKNEEAVRTITFINSQLSSISDSVAVSEGNLKSFRISNQIVDVPSYTGQLLNDSRQLENSGNQFRLTESYFNYLKKYLSKNNQDEFIVVPSSLGINDVSLAGLVSKYNETQEKKREVGEQNPYYKKYESDLELIKTSLTEVLVGMKASLDIQKNDLSNKKRDIEQRISQLPNKESQMSKYQRRFKINDDYYTFLLQQRAQSEIQQASNTADNLVLEQARIIGTENNGVKQKTTMTYFFIGLLLPIIFVLLKEFLNNKIIDRKDIEKLSPYPYIGSIRHSNSKNPLPVLKNPRSGLAESYRVIRTRTEFFVQRQSPVKMLVTSTESGDGKTAFSLNMTAMYALTGRRTLLIDLDLRKPSVADRLNLQVDRKHGLSNYLIGQIDKLDDLIIKNDKLVFDIIPGGTIPPNPGELIRSEKLQILFDELSKIYDYIVIDTSPVGLVADAYALMHLVDINLFLARSEKTNKMFFKSVIQQLKADKTPNISVALNDVDDKKVSYSSYHDYGRRSYYMKREAYHSYTTDYFDEEEEMTDKNRKKKGLLARLFNWV